MAVIYREISRDAAQALTEFSADFDAALALGSVDPWCERFGLKRTSKAVRTIFPLNISAAGYKERKGDDKLRHLYERSLSLTTKEWVDGVEERAQVIEAPDFVGWDKEPGKIALESQRHSNVLISDILASNPYLDFYRVDLPGGPVASSIQLFSGSHLINVFEPGLGTFDNDQTWDKISAENVKTLRQYFWTLPGPNGRPLNLELTDILSPVHIYDDLLDFFERDVLIQTIENASGAIVGGFGLKNRFYQTVKVTKAAELTGALPSGASGDTHTFYALASGGPAPWVIQDTGAPEEIRYDKQSDFYKDTGKVAVKFVKTVGAAAALPHAIARVQITG